MAQITAAAAVVIIFLIMPFFFFRIYDRRSQSVAIVWQKSICNVRRRRMMMMVMVIIGWRRIISTLQSILVKEIFGWWVEATRVYWLCHVEILSGCGSVRNGRRRVHWIQVRVCHGYGCGIGNVVYNGWRWTRQLSRGNCIRRLSISRTGNFSLRSACRKKIAQLSFIATVGSLRGSAAAAVVVQSRGRRSIRCNKQLICFREVTRRETRV